MNDPMDLFRQPKGSPNAKVLRESLASPEQIRSWSCGEVTRPDTFNKLSLKPDKDGLCCARIFGPIKDYECLCGRYRGMNHKGVVCEKCGVEVTVSAVRGERIGHIELAAPAAHIWFLQDRPSSIGLIIDIGIKKLERFINFRSYVVVEPGETSLKKLQLLNEDEFYTAQKEFGEDGFRAEMGAGPLKEILSNLDLAGEKEQVEEEMRETGSEAKYKKYEKRLNLIHSFIDSGTRPEWMMLDLLPVLPPALRPSPPSRDGGSERSDLDELYRRVINRNNRLKRLIELKAPEVIVVNEKRMLQESVDAVFENGRCSRVFKDVNGRPWKSLSEMSFTE